MNNFANSMVDSMKCYVGQTVTVFTSSGGISGSGYTGVLLSIDCNVIRLLCSVGAAPSCPIGSSCVNPNNFNNNCDFACGGSPLGAIAVIPTGGIVCFTHNAV